MWPFRNKPPDTRPASEASIAVAKSLETEPLRWKIGKYGDQLIHDSQIMIDTDGWIRQPNLCDESDASGEIVAQAIETWIVARLNQPEPAQESDHAE